MTRGRKLLMGALLVLLAVSLAGLGSHLPDTLRTHSQSRQLARQLQSQPPVSIPAPVSSVTQEPEDAMAETAPPVMLEKFRTLHTQNPDMIGWITIADSRIDYPVMHTPDDPEFYLRRDFDKQPNRNGLPFLDERSDPEHSDFLLIHGHNMKNGLMFSDLLLYKEESYYRAHSVVRLDTLYEEAEYEIVAVILARALYTEEEGFRYYETGHITTSAAFDAYMQSIQALALYETDAEADYGDKLILLSTCEYSQENGRLAVIARRL